MVIGIVGTHGAGKGAVVQFFKERGFVHCSARAIFIEELEKRGIPANNRSAISQMANELRAEHGVDYVVRLCMQRHDPSVEDLIIESIYTLGEADAIRSAGGFVISVDADPSVRFERIKHRMSETDRVTKEEFLKKQEEEARSTDPIKQNSRTVMEQADYAITNDGTLEELKVEVEYILEKLGLRVVE